MKGFIEEFKAFISKGDAVSMAVGIIIGGAFTSIVNSVVENLLNPIIGFATQGIDLSSITLDIGPVSFGVGAVLSAVLTFLLTALVLFWIVKGYNKAKDKMEKQKEEEAKVTEEQKPDSLAEAVEILKEIKESIKK